MADTAHKAKAAGKNEKLTLVALAVCILALIAILITHPF